jgi:predicted ester cyclase
MSQANKDLVRRLIDKVEGGDPVDIDAALNADLASNFVDRSLLPGQGPGRADYKRTLLQDRAAFSDFHITIEDQIAEGDKVVTRLTWRATHDRGTFMGIPPTRRQVQVTAIYIHRIAGGKVTEEWSASDALEKLR